jgi:hypothetical protein
MSTVIIAAIITGAAAIIAAITGPIAFHIYIERLNRADLKRLTYGKEVAIQVSDGTYLKADANSDGTLVGGSQEIKAWNIFTIVKADPSSNKPTKKTISDGDKVGFKAKVKGKWKYVSVRLEGNEQKQLEAKSAKLDSWQTFIICTTEKNEPGVFHYSSPFALKAPNDNMVTYNSRRDSGTKRLIAIYDDHISWAETFVFVNPHARSDH